MFELILSIVVLFVGPVLHRLAQRARPAIEFLDGFTFISITALVLFEILPESVALAGAGAIVVALLGLFGPLLFEQMRDRVARRAHQVALGLALCGFLAHAFLDGVALSEPGENEGSLRGRLAIAVLLHRLPVGLTLWWLLSGYGRRIAWGIVCAVSIATVGGYLVGGTFHLEGASTGLFIALLGGSLLHVVIHAVQIGPRAVGSRGWHVAAALGAVVAVFVVRALLDSHDHGHSHSGHDHSGHDHGSPGGGETAFWSLFLHLCRESAPVLLLAYFAAGVVHAFLPAGLVGWLRRGRPSTQALRGLVFGLPLPICSCGVLPVYRGLIKQGVPLAAALALLVATPELGLDAVLLTFKFLGTEFAWVRLAGAAVIALAVGWGIGRLFQRLNPVSAEAAAAADGPVGFGQRLGATFRVGFGEILDDTGPWLLLGIAIAALAHPLIHDAQLWSSIPPALEVTLFALLGMPVYVCASGRHAAGGAVDRQRCVPGCRLCVPADGTRHQHHHFWGAVTAARSAAGDLLRGRHRGSQHRSRPLDKSVAADARNPDLRRARPPRRWRLRRHLPVGAGGLFPALPHPPGAARLCRPGTALGAR